jgi:cytochrome c2
MHSVLERIRPRRHSAVGCGAPAKRCPDAGTSRSVSILRKHRCTACWITTIALATTLAGCGSNPSSTSTGLTSTRSGSTATSSFADASIPNRDLPGAKVLLRAGCLACHRIGSAGNNDPGPSLTRVGARRDTQAITQALISPAAPMPSYGRWLSATELRQLVEYLSHLG